jgi:hypothetical protein
MPPYRFLFETRRIEQAASPDALPLSGDLAPRPGFEVIPTSQARSLVAYLMSLHADAPLYSAPLTVPNAPAPTTNAPAAPGTVTNAAFVPNARLNVATAR